MSKIQTPVSTSQVKELLLARGQQAACIRGGLISLLAERTQIPDLMELPIGNLVGEMLAIETPSDLLGCIIEMIIMPTLIEEPKSHKAARHIMGNNFLGIPEVATAFGFVGQKAQAELVNIPFDEATLRSCRDTHVLVADIGLSIIDVRGRMRRNLFRVHEKSWYNTENFAKCTEKACWRLIRKTPVANSTSKDWNKQTALLVKNEEVPTARQVVYAIMLYFTKTNERLFERVCVRTIDVISSCYHVYVGDLQRGLCINRCGDDEAPENIGVSSSRKQPNLVS